MRTMPHFSAAALAAVAVLAAAPAQAHADQLPFNDTNVNGSIGLCDATGSPIRSGAMSAHPFVAMAASSVGAPDGFTGTNSKATLYAFQPRKDVDPGEWSGEQMTGSSVYADSGHPMVSGTNLDPSLKDFVSGYPANWDGLVELRIYYTAPNKVPYRRTYPAAVLRVSGDTWSVVQGADVTCDSKKVISSERLLLPPSAFNKPAAPSSGKSTGTPAGTGAKPAAGTPAASGHTATAGSSGAVDAGAASEQHRNADSGVPAVAWAVAAAAVLAAASGGWLWWRRRGA